MTYAFVVGATPVGSATGGTTAGVNTTGADFIALVVTWYQPSGTPTVSDNKSNTYTPLTIYTFNGGQVAIYYKQAPAVGSGHTFTVAGVTFASIGAMAFSGSTASPFNKESGSGNSLSTTQPGSLTPDQANSLLISAISLNFDGTFSISAPFTLIKLDPLGGSNFGTGIAYSIQTTATASNPTITNTASSPSTVTTLAVFKPAVGGSSHAATGVLVGQGSTIAGTAVHKTKHTTTGALVGQGSVIAGVAKHWHKALGALVGPGSVIVGTARRFRAHATSGTLVGQGSAVVGSSAHTATGNHPSTGVLVGQGSIINGVAKRNGKHPTVGILIGQGSVVNGTASGPVAAFSFKSQNVRTEGIVFDESLLQQLVSLGVNPTTVMVNGIVQSESLARALLVKGINPATLLQSGNVYNEALLRQIQDHS